MCLFAAGVGGGLGSDKAALLHSKRRPHWLDSELESQAGDTGSEGRSVRDGESDAGTQEEGSEAGSGGRVSKVQAGLQAVKGKVLAGRQELKQGFRNARSRMKSAAQQLRRAGAQMAASQLQGNEDLVPSLSALLRRFGPDYEGDEDAGSSDGGHDDGADSDVGSSDEGEDKGEEVVQQEATGRRAHSGKWGDGSRHRVNSPLGKETKNSPRHMPSSGQQQLPRSPLHASTRAAPGDSGETDSSGAVGAPAIGAFAGLQSFDAMSDGGRTSNSPGNGRPSHGAPGLLQTLLQKLHTVGLPHGLMPTIKEASGSSQGDAGSSSSHGTSDAGLTHSKHGQTAAQDTNLWVYCTLQLGQQRFASRLRRLGADGSVDMGQQSFVFAATRPLTPRRLLMKVYATTDPA